MSIQNKDWHAHIDKMPGLEGPKFMVSGVVTVPNSTTEATLVLSPHQDKSPGLRLILNLEDKGIGLPALTEKAVSYSQPAPGYDITHVQIFYKDQELVRINNVEIVN